MQCATDSIRKQIPSGDEEFRGGGNGKSYNPRRPVRDPRRQARAGVAVWRRMPERDDSVTKRREQELFVTTHWSVVLTAGLDETHASHAALEQLCLTYWYPLYVYSRRRGYDVEEAKDLTQEFFARLIAKNYLGQVEMGRGRFRYFLLAALKHFLSD